MRHRKTPEPAHRKRRPTDDSARSPHPPSSAVRRRPGARARWLGFRRASATLASLWLLLSWADGAQAQLAAQRLDQAAESLRHGDAASARKALAQLAAARGMPAAARALRGALEAGLPDDLVVPALDALSGLGGPDAQAALTEFTSHRRVPVRLAAYRGLVGLSAPTASAFLADGLRDSDPRVRDLCARGLGELGARERVDVLLLALSRGVYAAAEAVGRLGDGTTAVDYAELLERLPLSVMLRGYRAFLARNDFPSEDKLAIIARLTEVASPEVRRFLQMVLVSVDWRREPEVKKALELAIARIVDQPEGVQ